MEELAVFTVIETCNLPRVRGETTYRQYNRTSSLILRSRVIPDINGWGLIEKSVNSPVFFLIFFDVLCNILKIVSYKYLFVGKIFLYLASFKLSTWKNLLKSEKALKPEVRW